MKYAITSLIVIAHLIMFMWVDSNQFIKSQSLQVLFYVSTLIPVAIIGAIILGSDNDTII